MWRAPFDCVPSMLRRRRGRAVWALRSGLQPGAWGSPRSAAWCPTPSPVRVRAGRPAAPTCGSRALCGPGSHTVYATLVARPCSGLADDLGRVLVRAPAAPPRVPQPAGRRPLRELDLRDAPRRHPPGVACLGPRHVEWGRLALLATQVARPLRGLPLGEPRPDPADVLELTVLRERKQQRADLALPVALARPPADDDGLLRRHVLDLQPRAAAPPRCVLRVAP